MMGDAVEVATTAGSTVFIEGAALEEFKNGLRGRLLLLPAENGNDDDRAAYDEARKLFNAMVDKKPALIVQCAGASDVMDSARLAKRHRLLMSVKGTGHNVSGSALCDGGLVVDLSRMKGVRVDVRKRTVRCEAGCTWGDVNHELQAFGLHATGGFISTTGVGGLTLGGGLGWLIRKHGFACDNLVEVDVVTAADGDVKLLTASETQNSDLFWAVRGGGGNFGVVTSFEFRAHPVGAAVLAGMVAYPASSQGESAVRNWRDFTAAASSTGPVPEELSSGIAMATAPPAPFVPDEYRGQPVVAVAGVYCGNPQEGIEVLRPIRDHGTPAFDVFQPMPCSAAGKMMDGSFPWGHRNYWKSSILKTVSDGAIATMLSFFSRVPSPLSLVAVEHNGDGAINKVSPSETAVGHRDWTYDILICSIWKDSEDDEKNIRWARDFWEAMQPFCRDAVYVNYLGDEGADRVKSAYADGTYKRLAELKNKYDPTNLFRFNQNITPAVQPK